MVEEIVAQEPDWTAKCSQLLCKNLLHHAGRASASCHLQTIVSHGLENPGRYDMCISRKDKRTWYAAIQAGRRGSPCSHEVEQLEGLHSKGRCSADLDLVDVNY